jgi:hypothetical protein
MATVKYALRKDRKQIVDVISPIYGIAAIVGPDGKKTELPREEFNQLYEPVLAPANLVGVDLGRPNQNNTQALSDIQESLSDLHKKTDDLHDKLDRLGDVILPPKGV